MMIILILNKMKNIPAILIGWQMRKFRDTNILNFYIELGDLRKSNYIMVVAYGQNNNKSILIINSMFVTFLISLFLLRLLIISFVYFLIFLKNNSTISFSNIVIHFF